MGAPLYVMSHFTFAAFKILSLLLIIMCLMHLSSQIKLLMDTLKMEFLDLQTQEPDIHSSSI